MMMYLKVVAPERLIYRSVLMIEPPNTRFFLGFSNTNLICGRCKTILAQDVNPKDLPGKLMKCNSCQSINEVLVDN